MANVVGSCTAFFVSSMRPSFYLATSGGIKTMIMFLKVWKVFGTTVFEKRVEKGRHKKQNGCSHPRSKIENIQLDTAPDMHSDKEECPVLGPYHRDTKHHCQDQPVCSASLAPLREIPQGDLYSIASEGGVQGMSVQDRDCRDPGSSSRPPTTTCA